MFCCCCYTRYRLVFRQVKDRNFLLDTSLHPHLQKTFRCSVSRESLCTHCISLSLSPPLSLILAHTFSPPLRSLFTNSPSVYKLRLRLEKNAIAWARAGRSSIPLGEIEITVIDRQPGAWKDRPSVRASREHNFPSGGGNGRKEMFRHGDIPVL